MGGFARHAFKDAEQHLVHNYVQSFYFVFGAGVLMPSSNPENEVSFTTWLQNRSYNHHNNGIHGSVSN